MSPFFCLWNPESPRAVSFTGNLVERSGEWPASMSWEALLQGAELPPRASGTILRIDSPGKNWEVEKLLLHHGAAMPDSRYAFLNAEEVQALADDPGRVNASRQHHAGFCAQLSRLQSHYENAPVRWMQHPEDIAVMCDKAACHAALERAGASVPQSLGVVQDFDDLMSRMDRARRNRVFLKLCHGSSASGTVALERSGGRMQAFSTAKMREGNHGEVMLYNWRAISRYTDLREIRQLVDAVCRHRAVAEVWLPKAGWRGKRFDVRIVVIGGRACHTVARLAEGPFTNLQFGALRASAEELAGHLGRETFDAMCREAERAMACFPRSLYGGVDVLLDTRSHQPYILEVNAFGDLLPSVRHEGRSTYDWEITTMLDRGASGSM